MKSKIYALLICLFAFAHVNAQTELIQNGNFSGLYSGWNTSGNWYISNSFSCYNTATAYAYVGNSTGDAVNNASGNLYQSVTIPSNTTSASLSYKVSINTDETSTSTTYDYIAVYLTDLSWNPLTSTTANSYGNLQGATGSSGCQPYQTHSFSIPSSLFGQTVQVVFHTYTDGAKYTKLRVDDVSLMATVSSCTAVSIASQPQNQTVASGSTATFSVTANGTAPILYFWYKNGIQIPGATSSSYTTPTLTATDNGNTYYCNLLNCNNQNGVTSNTATLTITGSSCIASFTVSKSSITQGGTITTTNNSSGNPTPTYLWSASPSTGVSFLPSSTATNPSITFANTGAYTIYLTATNSNGSNQTNATITVTSSGSAPTATTNVATNITSTSVQLNGTVNPNGASTTYYFQYGTTTNYGSNTSTQNAGSGTNSVPENEPISGLTKNTTYHYRIVATNSTGTTYGSDVTFITIADYLTIGNLKISGNNISGSEPNYTVTGNIQIGWKNFSGYLVNIPNGVLQCNTSSNIITVTSGDVFSIPGIQGYTWNFVQTQNWTFAPIDGKVAFNSHLGLGSQINLVSSNFNLDFQKKTISGSATFEGIAKLAGLNTFNVNIDLAQLAFDLQLTTGQHLMLGPLDIGILENTAGISFNIQKTSIGFDETGNLLTLKFVGIDGVEFDLAPAALSIGVEWDILAAKVVFTEDTKIEIDPGEAAFVYLSDSTYQALLKSGKLHFKKTPEKVENILGVGLTIHKGTYIDLSNLTLDGTATIDLNIYGLKLTAASASLSLDYPNSTFSGSIAVPGITIKNAISNNDWFIGSSASFKFQWGNPSRGIYPDYIISGHFASLVPVFPTIDASIEANFSNNIPKLICTASYCLNFFNWPPVCSGPQQFFLSSKGLEFNGRMILGNNQLSKYSAGNTQQQDSVYILANPLANTVSGIVFDPITITGTNIKTKPNSTFNIEFNSSTNDYGDLHLYSVVDGVNLTWNYHNHNSQPITVDLSQFEGLSLALASDADLKLQSDLNANRFIQIKSDGGITISQFNDGLSYYSPDTTFSGGRKWKIIHIYPDDPNETFSMSISTANTKDTLLFTMINENINSGNQSRIQNTNASNNSTRFVLFNDNHIAANNIYSMSINEQSTTYSLSNGSESFNPIFLTNINTVPGALSISRMKDFWQNGSFHVTWETSDSATSIIQFGPEVRSASNTLVSNQLNLAHEIIIPGSSVQNGWVYQIQSKTTDSEYTFSEWRIVSSPIVSGIKQAGVTNNPKYYSLSQNYPNPFNPSTVISYDVPHQSYVKIIVYDVLGREVMTLVNADRQPGSYQVSFSASQLSSGIYLYRMTAGNFSKTKKLILLK